VTEGVSGRIWTVLFVEVLLAGRRTYPKGKVPQRISGAMDGEPNVNVTGDGAPNPWLQLPFPGVKAEGTMSDITDNYAEFCRIISQEKSNGDFEDCFLAISKLSHADYFLSQSLLEKLLPAAWERIPTDDFRSALVPGIESLLSRPYHFQFVRSPSFSSFESVVTNTGQQARGINAIKSFLMSLVKFRPLPVLDTNLLVLLAENYNCWHEVLTLLEDQYDVISTLSLESKAEQLKDATASAIRHCFKRLGEGRICISLASRDCLMPETRHALSLDLHDMTKEAIEAYSGLVTDCMFRVNP
jgi:hypothetical protein